MLQYALPDRWFLDMSNVPQVPVAVMKQACAAVVKFADSMSPISAIIAAFIGQCGERDIEQVIRRYIALRRLTGEEQTSWTASVGGSDYSFSIDALCRAAASAPLIKVERASDSAFDAAEFAAVALAQLRPSGHG